MTAIPAQDAPADDQCPAEEPAVCADVYAAQFEAFYRQFFPILASSLIWDGASPPLAADVVQLAMKKAWASWSTIANPEAWVWTTARRELFRRQKASRREVLADPVTVCGLLSLDEKGMGAALIE